MGLTSISGRLEVMQAIAGDCVGRLVQGQPGFFSPRHPTPWFSFAGAQSATSYYDNAPLRETLEDLVDFSLLNEKTMPFSAGR